MILSTPDFKTQFGIEIDRLYEKIHRPYKSVEEDIKEGKLKLVESSKYDNLYIVYRDKVKVGVLDVQTKCVTIKYI